MRQNLPTQVTPVNQGGLDCLRLHTLHGDAVLALHGGQLLSWTPRGERDVFWLSPQLRPLPAAIRGGVPICWPWFARQGAPAQRVQHGPVRNLTWRLTDVHANDEQVSIGLAPQPHGPDAWPYGLELQQTICLGHGLTQTLHTHNAGSAAFSLTQALHSYFAVGDAARVGIEGLQHLRYRDKLLGDSEHTQQLPFALDTACDRIYGAAGGHYALLDPVWQRRIVIESSGSRSLVVWNPGAEQAAAMPDVGASAWPHFFCLEVANAGADSITLAPGQGHRLTQSIRVERSRPAREPSAA
jgi:glucose-6-phosphate 1-epimerase